MRKFSFLVLMALMCLVSQQANAASVIQVAAPADLYSYVTAATDGDVIELTTSGGAYTWSASVTITTEKALTIRAEAGLAARPVITSSSSSSYFLAYNSTSTLAPTKKWIFDGIEINAYSPSNGSYRGYFFYSTLSNSTYYGMNVDVNNCVFKKFSYKIFQINGNYGLTTTHGGNYNLNNCEFRELRGGVLAALNCSLNNVRINNCLFLGPSLTPSLYTLIYLSSNDFDSFLIDHCTFINSTFYELNIGSTKTPSYIKNSIFSNNVNTTYNNIYTDITLGSDCGVYYTGTGIKSLIYPNSTAALSTDPALDPTTSIATAAAYKTGSTDGYPIGYYGSSVISTSINSLTGFDIVGSTVNPSTQQSFTVSGTGLTANTIVTPPTNYQISTTSGSGFASTPITLTQTAGTVASTTIYVRLKAGLADNTYTGDITLTSTGIPSKKVALSGTVTNAKTIYTSSASLSGFKYAIGGGPSAEQSITINAVNLTSNLSLTAPSNYEISPLPGASFIAISPMTFAQTGGAVSPTTIYVRLKAGLAVNSYDQNLSLTATGATTKEVALSGKVNDLPAVSNSVSSISGLYSVSSIAYSTEQSFTVSGTDLTTPIIVTPPANFQISTTSGASFTSSAITLPLVNNGVSATTIYVRIDPAYSNVTTVSGDLSIATTGVTTKTVALSGTSASRPLITTSVTTLSALDYFTGTGPSAEKSFTVSASDLMGNVVVTPPASYEISLASGSSFVASPSITLTPTAATLASTTIYVRLKAGLSAASYAENVSIASSGALSKTVAASGSVTNRPTVTVLPTSLTSMDYNLGFGPSAEKTFKVSGQYLSSIILITPPDNFEISTSTGASFAATNPILISQSGGTAAQTTIYVRLKVGLVANAYNGDIAITSPGAVTQNLSCSGTITNRTSITPSTTTLADMKYDLGFGPSNEKSFTVSGNYLSTNLLINAPTNFEISKTTGALFSPQSQLSIPLVGGVAASTTIYVRMKAGLTPNDYTGDITITSPEAITQSVACSGTVFDPVNLTIQVGQNGTITENSTNITNGSVLVVLRGKSKTFTITPNLGYEIATATYNGNDIKSELVNNQFVATVNNTSVLSVTYKKIQFVLSLKDASSGTIDLIIDYGSTPSFKFSPIAGWKVSTVFYNNDDVTSSLVDGIYTVPAIVANGLLNISFVQDIKVGTPQLVNGKIKVYTNQSNIIVEGTSNGEAVSLFTVNGVQIQALQSQGDRMVIPVQKDAVYLVKTSNMTFKVIL